MTAVISAIKRLGSWVGVDIQRIDHTLARARQRLLNHGEVDLVLDVGANRGQYGMALRRSGFRGRIVSFEPIPEAFEQLKKASASDPLWRVENCALGIAEEERTFHVSDNLASSSFFQVTDKSTDAHSGTRQVREISVQVRTLDSFASGDWDLSKAHLKIDTQGFELEVLKGGGRVLPRLFSIECELSLVPLYQDQPMFPEVCQFLYDQGYHATWIERGFNNQDYELLQVDAFFRNGLTTRSGQRS